MVSAYESGSRDPSVTTLERLVGATGGRLRLVVEGVPAATAALSHADVIATVGSVALEGGHLPEGFVADAHAVADGTVTIDEFVDTQLARLRRSVG